MKTKYYKKLENAYDIELVGGKAKMLGTLIRNGINVPDGWVITTEMLFWLFELCGLKRSEVWDALQDSSKPFLLRDVLKNSKWPKEVYNMLKELYTLTNPPLCVRSSAVNEDADNASLAGVYRSNINIRTFGEFLWAVRDCMLSSFDEHALLYAKRVKKPLSMMAVVIQPLVNSAVSGVAIFEDGSLYVTAAYGLGLGVVSGSSSADYFEWKSRECQAKICISNKEIAFFPNNENRAIYKDIIEPQFVNNEYFKASTIEYDKRHACLKCRINSTKRYDFIKEPVLNTFLQNNLKDALFNLYESHLGYGNWDIEWSISPEGEIFILQVRPLVSKNQMEDRSMIIQNSNTIFKGAPISSGCGSGILRIIKGETDLVKIQQGDIAYMGWIPDNFISVLSKVKALVIINEWGMSHCAILAREWQIPCVGGVPEQIFIEGESYSVNGSTGEIIANKSLKTDKINEINKKNEEKDSGKANSFILLPWFIHAISEIYSRPLREGRYVTYFKSIVFNLGDRGIIDLRDVFLETEEGGAFRASLYSFIAKLIFIALKTNNKIRFALTFEEIRILEKVSVDYGLSIKKENLIPLKNGGI